MTVSRHIDLPKRTTNGAINEATGMSVERVALRYTYLQGLVVRRRHKTSNRFQNALDWIRLVMLGIVIVNLGVFAFHRSFFGNVISNYYPGTPSVFGGMFLAIIVIKMGRPKLYLDWIALGCLYAAAGMFVVNDASLSTPVAQTFFLLALLTSSTLTVFIGITLNASTGDPGWVTAAGLTGFFCMGGAWIGPWISVAVSPDILLAVDLILLGMGIAGFGYSLRRNGQNIAG